MEDFSFSALMALAWANKLLTSAVIATLLSAILIKMYWDTVGYFLMRVWHGTPLIGTVARLANGSTSTDQKKWLLSEASLCNNYYDYYQDVGVKNADFYNKCGSYLATIGEIGRRERPIWVMVLIFLLILFEAVGFAYVLVPFINQNLSSNDQAYLGWMAAFLLSIISAGFAEAAGRAIHHNSLVAKARHWWESDRDVNKVTPLKQLPTVQIEVNETDEGGKDYNRILARIVTNQSVTPRYGWIVGCALVVVIMACAAFGIRAYQLKSIETDMVGNPSAFAEQSYESSASPFELPADSAAVNQEANDSTLADKMSAIRSASLITFVVLSVIYVAIQAVSVWLASIFGFAGVESKRAWQYTHKFNNAAELERWMRSQRGRIAAQADHKLRMLQMKLSKRTTTDSDVQSALKDAHGRDFNAYVLRMQAEDGIHCSQPQPSASRVEQSTLSMSSLAVAVAPALATIEGHESAAGSSALGTVDYNVLRSLDLTKSSHERLVTICANGGYDLDTVLVIRAEQQKQQLLKDFDEA